MPARLNINLFLDTVFSEKNYPYSLEDAHDFLKLLPHLLFNTYGPGIDIEFLSGSLEPNFKDKARLERLISGYLLPDFFHLNFKVNVANDNFIPHSYGSIGYFISNTIQQALVISTLSRPFGPLGTPSTIVMMDDYVLLHHRARNLMLLEHISQSSQTHRWPVLERLDLIDTWNWAIKRAGFLKGKSTTRVSRALSCFTQLFSESIQENYLSLIWSMIGLEAITNSGPNGAQHSFYTRIFEMIGEPKSRKAVIKSLYQERSKLLHGQYDLPSQFVDLEESIDIPLHPEKLYYAQSLASSILIGVLQYCAKNNLHDISFEMVKKEITD